MLLSVFARTDITNVDQRTPAMLAKLCGHTELLPYFNRLLISENFNTPKRISGSDNSNSVSISLLSIANVEQSSSSSVKRFKMSSKKIV